VEYAEFHKGSQLWVVRTQECELVSPWLVVATGENAEPVLPRIHGMDHFSGSIAHTSVYKSGSEYRNKKVLVIGCGNSGMEVSLDLCRHNALPYMVARNTVSSPSFLFIQFFITTQHRYQYKQMLLQS